MKKSIPFLKILTVSFISFIFLQCENEPVDFSILQNNIEEEIEEEITDEEIIDSTIFFTGLECVGTGEYLKDDSNLLEDLIIPNNLPNNYDLSHFLPPIGNQGNQGSCASWAVSYYMKSMQERIQSGEPFLSSTIMSPSYTYNQISQGNCGSTSLTQTLTLLKERGVCPMDSFPYFDNNCATQPSNIHHELAQNAKISDFKYLSGNNMVAEMKTLLVNQTPILISLFLSSEFGLKDEFNLTAYREHRVNYDSERCHGMLVVGYSDTYHAFKVVNSWGENWGDQGFVWIDYKAFENVSNENAYFRVINSALVAFDL